MVDFLVKNEAYAVRVWEMIEHNMLKLDNEGQDEHLFAQPPKMLSKVDKQLLAAWLCANSEGAISMERIKFHDNSDEHFIRDLALMFLKMSGTESLPTDCVGREILWHAMNRRLHDVQTETMASWAARSLTAGAPVDWTSSGAYSLIWHGEHLGKIRHRFSGAEADVPADIVIGRDYTMEHPTSDAKCTLTNGPLRRCVCIDFFPNTVPGGPHSNNLDKKGTRLREIVQAVGDFVRAERAKSSSAALSCELKDHSKERRNQALEKARAKLAERPVKRTRTLALGDDTT